MNDLSRAQRAYEAYFKDAGGKTFDGRPMPAWDFLGEAVQQHWAAAAKALTPLNDGFSARELAQIEHARYYAAHFADAGAPGSSQFLLIAKLADALSG